MLFKLDVDGLVVVFDDTSIENCEATIHILYESRYVLGKKLAMELNPVRHCAIARFER